MYHANFGGRGLLPVENVINQEKLALGEYLKASPEPLLQKVHACNWFDCSEYPSVFKSRQASEIFQAWRIKILHGQFLKEVEANCEINYQWKWLTSSNLKKETEGFITKLLQLMP